MGVSVGIGALALGSSMATVSAAQNAKNAAKRAAKAQAQQAEMAQKQYEDNLKKQEAAEAEAAKMESDAANRNSARSRQKAMAAGAQGRSDTILTSPLGLSDYGTSASAGKTLLGA